MRADKDVVDSEDPHPSNSVAVLDTVVPTLGCPKTQGLERIWGHVEGK
jgi:hypothetical protein